MKSTSHGHSISRIRSASPSSAISMIASRDTRGDLHDRPGELDAELRGANSSRAGEIRALRSTANEYVSQIVSKKNVDGFITAVRLNRGVEVGQFRERTKTQLQGV